MKQAGYMAMSFSTKEYFVKETYKSIRRNGFMSFASISNVSADFSQHQQFGTVSGKSGTGVGLYAG